MKINPMECDRGETCEIVSIHMRIRYMARHDSKITA